MGKLGLSEGLGGSVTLLCVWLALGSGPVNGKNILDGKETQAN